jgi:hypothetical protein
LGNDGKEIKQVKVEVKVERKQEEDGAGSGNTCSCFYLALNINLRFIPEGLSLPGFRFSLNLSLLKGGLL